METPTGSLPFRQLVPVFLIAAGALFLLDGHGVPGFGWIVKLFWPALLVAFGLNAWARTQRRWGGALLLGGAALWCDNFNLLHWRLERWWPLALMAAGVALLVERESERGAP